MRRLAILAEIERIEARRRRERTVRVLAAQKADAGIVERAPAVAACEQRVAIRDLAERAGELREREVVVRVLGLRDRAAGAAAAEREYGSTSLRPPRPPAGATGSIAAAQAGTQLRADIGTPRLAASVTISALAPSITPVLPIMTATGKLPSPSPKATSERAPSRALAGASHA
jgi:hypothetical protein